MPRPQKSKSTGAAKSRRTAATPTSSTASRRASPGVVHLVGAGPGDAGLLTVRGAELLSRAEVVVYDVLVNPDILRLANPGAELIHKGKQSKDRPLSQEELNGLLIEKARAGRRVVRLKGGDPYLFGRGGEEASALAAAGVNFEVVPGVSSISAVPNYAGIPVTHRDHCSMFTVITGHEEPGKGAPAVDWNAVARIPGTKVILMGVKRIRTIADGLMSGGLAATTPVAMVRWGTMGRQETIEADLGSIAARVAEIGFHAPAITVIGEVVGLRRTLNWFENRPLFRKKVVVTRTRSQSSQLSSILNDWGAEVLEVPTIRTEPPSNRAPLVEAIAGIAEYNWLVFTSPNGVTAFLDALLAAYEDIRAIGGLRIAAVGPATAARVRDYRLRVDVMPEAYIARNIVAAMGEVESIENLRILLARAEVATPELPQLLEEKGGIVDDVACYRTVPETADPGGVAGRLVEEGADWVTFASGSAVENFHARFDLPGLMQRFTGLRIASIGPETSKSIRALGVEPAVEARQHTIEGLAKALLGAD